jgi:hypothetical protein
MLVVNPDHLVSGTSVVSALFCLRKAVLAEKFKGGGGGGSKVRKQCCGSMTFGCGSGSADPCL